jgi:hypothetical protein
MFVAGIVGLAQTFPFAIGLSVRRTDYFWGTAAMAGIASLTHALVLVVMAVIENATDSWGGIVSFFHIPYVNDGRILEQLWVYLALLMNGYFSGMAIASLYRRFGGYVLTAVLGLLFLLACGASLLFTYNLWWENIFNALSGHSAAFHALLTSLLTVFYAFLSSRFLRRAG